MVLIGRNRLLRYVWMTVQRLVLTIFVFFLLALIRRVDQTIVWTVSPSAA